RSLWGYASRTAAIAPQHGLAGLVPYSTPATQRTAAKSGSRHFYKNSLAARWLEVASATLFRFQSTDWAARSAGCSVRLAQVGLSLFDHLAGDREQRRRHGEFGRLGGFQL